MVSGAWEDKRRGAGREVVGPPPASQPPSGPLGLATLVLVPLRGAGKPSREGGAFGPLPSTHARCRGEEGRVTCVNEATGPGEVIVARQLTSGTGIGSAPGTYHLDAGNVPYWGR